MRGHSGCRAVRVTALFALFGSPRCSGCRTARDAALFGLPRCSGNRAVRESRAVCESRAVWWEWESSAVRSLRKSRLLNRTRSSQAPGGVVRSRVKKAVRRADLFAREMRQILIGSSEGLGESALEGAEVGMTADGSDGEGGGEAGGEEVGARGSEFPSVVKAGRKRPTTAGKAPRLFYATEFGKFPRRMDLEKVTDENVEMTGTTLATLLGPMKMGWLPTEFDVEEVVAAKTDRTKKTVSFLCKLKGLALDHERHWFRGFKPRNSWVTRDSGDWFVRVRELCAANPGLDDLIMDVWCDMHPTRASSPERDVKKQKTKAA